MSKEQDKKTPPPRKRLQDLSFTKMIPNLATVIALCTGLSAIRFALLGRWEHAVMAIGVAAIFDALDGKLARLLGASSDFGAELDSLSDFISFGVAPAVVMYILTLQGWKGLGWGVALFFAVCCGLRLARFNTYLRPEHAAKQPEWSRKFFVGVPAPGGAFIGLFPLIAFLATEEEFFLSPLFVSVILVFGGVLFVSRIPTFALKSLQIPRKKVLPFLLLAGLLAAFFANYPWMTGALVILAYLFSIPIVYLYFYRLKKSKLGA